MKNIIIFGFAGDHNTYTNKGMYEIHRKEDGKVYPYFNSDGDPKEVDITVLQKLLGSDVTEKLLEKALTTDLKHGKVIGCSRVQIIDGKLIVIGRSGMDARFIVTPELSDRQFGHWADEAPKAYLSQIEWVRKRFEKFIL